VIPVIRNSNRPRRLIRPLRPRTGRRGRLFEATVDMLKAERRLKPLVRTNAVVTRGIYLTPEEAARLLDCSPAVIRGLMESGRVCVTRLRHRPGEPECVNANELARVAGCLGPRLSVNSVRREAA
jgi:hypothetical protein